MLDIRSSLYWLEIIIAEEIKQYLVYQIIKMWSLLPEEVTEAEKYKFVQTLIN